MAWLGVGGADAAAAATISCWQLGWMHEKYNAVFERRDRVTDFLSSSLKSRRVKSASLGESLVS